MPSSRRGGAQWPVLDKRRRTPQFLAVRDLLLVLSIRGAAGVTLRLAGDRWATVRKPPSAAHWFGHRRKSSRDVWHVYLGKRSSLNGGHPQSLSLASGDRRADRPPDAGMPGGIVERTVMRFHRIRCWAIPFLNTGDRTRPFLDLSLPTR